MMVMSLHLNAAGIDLGMSVLVSGNSWTGNSFSVCLYHSLHAFPKAFTPTLHWTSASKARWSVTFWTWQALFCPMQMISLPAPAAPAAPPPGQPPCLSGSGKGWCLGVPSYLVSLAAPSPAAIYPHSTAMSVFLKACLVNCSPAKESLQGLGTSFKFLKQTVKALAGFSQALHPLLLFPAHVLWQTGSLLEHQGWKDP